MEARVILEVVDGVCQGGEHRVGDQWAFDGSTPDGMCLGAFYPLLPCLFPRGPRGVTPCESRGPAQEARCSDPKGIALRLVRRLE